MFTFGHCPKPPQDVLYLLISSLISSSIIFIHILIMMKEREDYLHHLTIPSSSSPPLKSAHHNISMIFTSTGFGSAYVRLQIWTTNYSHCHVAVSISSNISTALHMCTWQQVAALMDVCGHTFAEGTCNPRVVKGCPPLPNLHFF